MTVPEPRVRQNHASAGSTLAGSLCVGPGALAPGAAKGLEQSSASPALQRALQREQRGTLPYSALLARLPLPTRGQLRGYKERRPGRVGEIWKPLPGKCARSRLSIQLLRYLPSWRPVSSVVLVGGREMGAGGSRVFQSILPGPRSREV